MGVVALVHRFRVVALWFAVSLLASLTLSAQPLGRPRPGGLLGGGGLQAPTLEAPAPLEAPVPQEGPEAGDAGGATDASGEPAGASEPESPRVQSQIADDDACRRVIRVRFTGLTRVNEEELTDSVRTRVGACLDRARAQRDARALWDLGFFRDVVVRADSAEGGVEVVFSLQERPSIHAVRFEGCDEVDEG